MVEKKWWRCSSSFDLPLPVCHCNFVATHLNSTLAPVGARNEYRAGLIRKPFLQLVEKVGVWLLLGHLAVFFRAPAFGGEEEGDVDTAS